MTKAPGSSEAAASAEASPTAVITGGGQRLGLAIAERLLDEGHNLVLCAHRSVAGAQELAERADKRGRVAHVVQGDLSTHAGTLALAKAVRNVAPDVDVLVNNAGLYERIAFADITIEQYRTMHAVNVDAPFFLTRELLTPLRAGDGGVVINIIDIAADRAIAGYAHYTASKAALLGVTRALAVELGPEIRVNGVSPGAVLFPADFSAERKAQILRRVPLQREGSAAAIADAVAYLVAADYVSGHILDVDGGRKARL